VVNFIDSVSSRLTAGGLDAVSARGAALALLDGRVTLQSMILAFEKSFLLQGALLLLVLPLVFFLRANRRSDTASPGVAME
jgi:hypothetical protein